MKTKLVDLNPCLSEEEKISQFYTEVPKVVRKLVKSWDKKDRFEHIGPIPIPSHESVVQIIHQARCILFPGYFSKTNLTKNNFEYYIGQETTCLYEKLAKQIIFQIK